jgi:NAD(P)-dependent dehydrogenase (short-subunit alcohol dehydrogenase family)
MSKWTPQQIPPQQGRLAIVTGANSGIGYQTARYLSRAGATVILACRNREKGEAARAKILAENPAAKVDVRVLDVAECDGGKCGGGKSGDEGRGSCSRRCGSRFCATLRL